jgi:tRNA(fMet)-specific endonuclease VapC
MLGLYEQSPPAWANSMHLHIKSVLRLKGHPLPENDIWIAAIALQYNLILVTRDAHFLEIENLQTVAW